ncbi:MAG TPA: DUF4348 domain-containing protein [Saprospiraceae bacterium]|nr:DUF4348 domain-containing protein [Saprospiraceae bacterium]
MNYVPYGCNYRLTVYVRLFRYFIVLVLITSLFQACKTKSSILKPDHLEDFDSFYEAFHRDEKFQLARIHFPLEGYRNDPEGETKWSKDNWEMMKVKIYDVNKKDFKTTWIKEAESFYQKVWIDGSGFLSEYRFERIKGKWFLTYAREENF